MTLRSLARDLYQAQQKVHNLRDQLETACEFEGERLKRELRQAEAECNQYRRILEGRKERGKSFFN